MKALLLFVVLFTQSAVADTFSYRLFYDEERTEVLDIKVDVTLTGNFNRYSKVSSVKVWGIGKNKKNVLLLSISAKDIQASWASGNVLTINSSSVKAMVKKQFYPYHSDTQIDPESDYRISDMVINQNGSVGDSEFYVANDSFDEMALAGYLKK